jgi:dual specificity protein kinase YAK1
MSLLPQLPRTDANNHLSCPPNATMASSERLYTVKERLGSGTFATVYRCEVDGGARACAVKVVKNLPQYTTMQTNEITLLKKLRKTEAHYFTASFSSTNDNDNDKNSADDDSIVSLLDFFMHRDHLCLVFPLYGMNLFSFLKLNKFAGASLTLIQRLLSQILKVLARLETEKIIHTDIKPENILLKGGPNSWDNDFVLIDFGSAITCPPSNGSNSYIQSRFYRSPEVLLGLPFDCSIDMWSLGITAAEATIGLPCFPGTGSKDMLIRHERCLGQIPSWMFELSPKYGEFGVMRADGSWRISRLPGDKPPAPTTYLHGTKLVEILNPGDESSQQLTAFIDLVSRMMSVDPYLRITPNVALRHPFVTGDFSRGPIPVDTLSQPEARARKLAGIEMRRSLRPPVTVAGTKPCNSGWSQA